MKKVLITLSIVTLIITLAVFTVHADANTVYCEKCNQDVSADDWQTWNFTGGDVVGGHYRLSDDFFDQNNTIVIPEDTIVCLDLCGYTYGTTKIRAFNILGTFTIMDSVGGGTILASGENGKYGGFALVQASGTLKLYDGTIRYASVPGVSLYSGGLFYIEGGRVDIYGGTVSGGTAEASSSYNSSGGNFTVQSNGRLNIEGGRITQGKALKSDSKTAQGGNIYVASGAKVTVSGGIIEDGYSDAGGGNIFLAEGTVEIAGGTIQNGHALVSGGNIMANAATDTVNTVTISGGKITGGVAGGTYGSYADGSYTRGTKGGGNLYERSPSGILNITGGEIDGDILLDYVKTMTLSGAPKIGLGKAGGLLFSDLGSFKANAKNLTTGAEIYVQSSRVFTTAFDSDDDAQAAMQYFKGAVRTTVSTTTSNTLQGKQGTQGYCPHCSEFVTWKNFNNESTFGGHSYLSGSLVRTSNLSVDNSWVLDLNGYTLHQENRRFIFNYNSQNLSLTILDSWGGGKIQGTGTGHAEGGLFYIWTNSTFELLSGTLRITAPIKDTTSTEKIVKSGGVINAGKLATVKISGGVIINGAATATDGFGGNIAMNGTEGDLLVTAGIISGGTAKGLVGGNIYSNGPVKISGGVIMNGSAQSGGNIYVNGTLEITGGMILKGNATGFGGNLYMNGSGDISGGFIGSGTATTAAGNIGIYKDTTTIRANAVVIGGNSSSRGGNIAIGSNSVLNFTSGVICSGNATTRGGNIDTAAETSVANVSGGTVILGTSANGGNIYINNGALNLTGGKVIGGSAKSGGNIYFNYYVYGAIKDDGNANTPLPNIAHGKATNGNGGNIYLTAADNSSKYYLYLGNCTVENGTATGHGNNIYVAENGCFRIMKEFAQTTSVYFHESRNPVKGGLLAATLCSAEGIFDGDLRLENITPSPAICAENGYLRVIAAEIIMKDGSSLGFGTNEDAIKNYNTDAAYLIANAGELKLDGGNYKIDLAGQTLDITGTGSITCFDSANNDYKSFGTVTIDGPTLENIAYTQHNGKTYITVAENGTYSFHCLEMKVESISIRPANAGVYYGSVWTCDDTLSASIKHFGVAVSLSHMPTENFATDDKVLYTQSTQDAFSVGNTANSVLIANILQQNNKTNDSRGRLEIYATPYINIDNGNGGEYTIIATSENQAQYSLYETMKLVDERIENDPLNYRKLTMPMRAFYEEWKDDGMQSWDLKKIPTPPDDDVIDVLMIGSSFCYYYVEELYGLAEAAGVKMRVCNVYYSGCRFTWHYTWWTQGKSNYEFYEVVDNTGRKKTSGVSLEYCLAQGDWDVISIQESTSTIYNAGAQNHLAETRDMRTVLLGYLKEQFPEAQVYWHQPWAYQIGYKSGSHTVDTFEDQQDRMMAIREFALGVCEENGVKRVNTGEAWQLYRKNYVGTNGLTDTLCARLGVGTNDVGDYYHDGDIGGGQYLNACVWFETIMKDLRPEENITCVGNTFSPIYAGKYTLSQDLIEALQQSAHQAVIERDWDTPSTAITEGA